MNIQTSETLLVGISGNVLLVGRKKQNETVEIINAFQGKEATELYRKLTRKRENNAKVSE